MVLYLENRIIPIIRDTSEGRKPTSTKEEHSPIIEIISETVVRDMKISISSVHFLQKYRNQQCQYLYVDFFVLQYIVVERRFVVFYEEAVKMSNTMTMEANDLKVIRNILRSMMNEHWSVSEALDEYDVPEYLRPENEAQIEQCFVN